MPTSDKRLVSLNGSPEWERYLVRLAKAVRATGTQLPDGHSALADYALTFLGLQHGILAPRRTRPLGTNRHGEPKATA